MRILFVCTGNTCRSPMAEGLFRKLAAEHGVQVEVASAGVATSDGLPISRHTRDILNEWGINDHITSQSMRNGTADWADLILTLTEAHKRHVIQSFPHAADKTYTLKEYVEDDQAVLAAQAELTQLIAEYELGRMMGRSLTGDQTARINQLMRKAPSYDISDPFGGSRHDYELTAKEITTALNKLIQKIKS